MVDNQHTPPKGKVITRGDPIAKYEKALGESAKAGHLVGYYSNEYTVKKTSPSIIPMGWISYEHTDALNRPDNYETEFSSGDIVGVVAGGSFEVYAFVTGSTTENVVIYPGTPLADNGDGTLKVAAEAKMEQDNTSPYAVTFTKGDRVVAIAQEYKSITTAGVERIHVISLI